MLDSTGGTSFTRVSYALCESPRSFKNPNALKELSVYLPGSAARASHIIYDTPNDRYLHTQNGIPSHKDDRNPPCPDSAIGNRPAMTCPQSDILAIRYTRSLVCPFHCLTAPNKHRATNREELRRENTDHLYTLKDTFIQSHGSAQNPVTRYPSLRLTFRTRVSHLVSSDLIPNAVRSIPSLHTKFFEIYVGTG